MLRRRLNQPQYVLRPRSMLRRLLRPRDSYDARALATARLPWGLEITVQAGESVGYTIQTAGVFDISVSEAIYRLLDLGDVATDVGAHVGYMTGLMATRVGSDGNVVAFEPHPDVFAVLERNVAQWNELHGLGPISTRRIALSNEAGRGELIVTESFGRNTGLASLRPSREWLGKSVEQREVELETLDRLFDDESLGLLKIDVEGTEFDVLQGGERILRERRVRDIVFEHMEDYPSDCTRFLEGFGLTILSLDHSLLGPRVAHASERPPRQGWEGPSYLATFEPARAVRRLRRRGWWVLGLGGRLAAAERG